MTKSAITIITVAIAVFFASCSNPAMSMTDGKTSAVNEEVNLEVTDSNNVVAEKEIAVTVPAEADRAAADEREVNVDAVDLTEEEPGFGLESEVVSAPTGVSGAENVFTPENTPGTEIESPSVDVTGPAVSAGPVTEDLDVKNRGKGKDNNKGKHNGLYK
jgi:hypothetical protein